MIAGRLVGWVVSVLKYNNGMNKANILLAKRQCNLFIDIFFT